MPPAADGYKFGPSKGTSLSLMKRLLYGHILYNSMAVGFESGWFSGDKLTPIGRLQQSAHRWVKEHGQPGVMHTPVAVLLDFYAGWTYPRHLYTGDVYRVWGNLPYAPGDYLTDAVLDMLYPGYQNSSYFHDESGFNAPTPYGDMADCLLSDAPPWLLARYPVVVVAGELSGGREIRDKLQAYLSGGGHLVVTEGNRIRSPQSDAVCKEDVTVEQPLHQAQAGPLAGTEHQRRHGGNVRFVTLVSPAVEDRDIAEPRHAILLARAANKGVEQLAVGQPLSGLGAHERMAPLFQAIVSEAQRNQHVEPVAEIVFHAFEETLEIEILFPSAGRGRRHQLA